jgi:hypothetical protein
MVCWPSFKHHKHNTVTNSASNSSHVNKNTNDITRGRKQVCHFILINNNSI